MSDQRKIRVLIADDHPALRRGLAAMIDAEPDMEAVGEAADGPAAVAEFCRLRPDVALVDLRMPGLDGADVTVAVRERVLTARLIILTTYDGDEDIYRALRAGAKAYFLKDTPLDELVACVRRVHAGETCLPPGVAAKLAERTASPDLTPRELEVLRHLAKGGGNKQIAAALFVTEETVKTHVKHLLDKLGAADRTQAVTTAVRRGLVRLD